MSEPVNLATPDWLGRRDGELRRGLGGRNWLLLLSGSPQYRLDVIPAKGRFTCAVTQSVNGKRLDPGTDHVTAEEALQAGLHKLREALGW